MVKEVGIEEWNNLLRVGECSEVVAHKEDICCIVNNVYCLCQRKNDCNNIVVYSNKVEHNVRNVKDVGLFLLYLSNCYNISCVTINCKPRRWKFLTSMFGSSVVEVPSYEVGRKKYIFYLGTDSRKILWRISMNE